MSNWFLNPANAMKAALGGYGSRDVTTSGPTASTEFYAAIQAIEDTTISACTDASGGPSTSFTGDLLAGTTIYGLFHSVGVSSGRLKCYLAGQV